MELLQVKELAFPEGLPVPDKEFWVHLVLKTVLRVWYYFYSHSTDEAQTGQATCPRSHSHSEEELGLNTNIVGSQFLYCSLLEKILSKGKTQWYMDIVKSEKLVC